MFETSRMLGGRVSAAALVVAGLTIACPRIARADRNPDVCTETGAPTVLTELIDTNDDGVGDTTAPATKNPGQTIYYQARIFHEVNTAAGGLCAFDQGNVCIRVPGSSDCVDVTPAGRCSGARADGCNVDGDCPSGETCTLFPPPGDIPLICQSGDDPGTECDPAGFASFFRSRQISYVVNPDDEGERSFCPTGFGASTLYDDAVSHRFDNGCSTTTSQTCTGDADCPAGETCVNRDVSGQGGFATTCNQGEPPTPTPTPTPTDTPTPTPTPTPTNTPTPTDTPTPIPTDTPTPIPTDTPTPIPTDTPTPTPTETPTPTPTPTPGEEICRTPGFWGTHAGVSQNRSNPLTADVIGLATGCIEICGEIITREGTVDGNDMARTDHADAAVEALCVPPRGDSRLQLVRQLTAAALNCIISGGGSDCSGTSIAGLFADCNDAAVCADGGTSTAGRSVTQCIEELDCFSNGGQFASNTNGMFCQTGTCSLSGNPCNESDHVCPETEVCNRIPGCHDRLFGACDDGSLCDDTNTTDGICDSDGSPCRPGPAGSQRECNEANSSACTTIAPGERMCGEGTSSPGPESCP